MSEEERTRTGLIEQKDQPISSGMPEGQMDRTWALRELLTVKFELLHYQSLS